MQVGDRVTFTGPEYKFSGLRIGERGTIIRMDGHHVQLVGEPPEELVTVQFENHDRPTVVSIRRISGDTE